MPFTNFAGISQTINKLATGPLTMIICMTNLILNGGDSILDELLELDWIGLIML
jgi:hypothetical protein